MHDLQSTGAESKTNCAERKAVPHTLRFDWCNALLLREYKRKWGNDCGETRTQHEALQLTDIIHQEYLGWTQVQDPWSSKVIKPNVLPHVEVPAMPCKHVCSHKAIETVGGSPAYC